MPIANGLENSYTDITSDNSWQTVDTLEVPESRGFVWSFHVSAVKYSTGDRAIFSQEGMGIREGSGDVALSSRIDVFPAQKTLGAALWDARLIADGANILFQIKGASGADVHWRCAGQAIGIAA